MSTTLERQRLALGGGLRAVAALVATFALAACARQHPAPASVSEEVAPARADDMTAAYECAVDAVLRSGLLLSSADPRLGNLEARSSLYAPGPDMASNDGTPVDIVRVGVRPAKTAAAGGRPVIGVSAETLVPRYGRPSQGLSEGVIWSVYPTSGRAAAARRAVLETCAGDTAARARSGA